MKATIDVGTVGFCPACGRLMEIMTEDEVGDNHEYWQSGWSCDTCQLNMSYIAPNDSRGWDEYADGEVEIIIQSVHR